MFGVPDEITDMMRSLEMVRRKDSYIGRLYSDIGKVPSDSGIFRSTRGVTGIRGNIWALVGFRGKREEDTRAGCAPHGPSPNWTRGRGGTPSFLLLSLSFLLPLFLLVDSY